MARWLSGVLLAITCGCASLGRLQPPPGRIAPCWNRAGLPGDALEDCAPEIYQESVSGPGAVWDHPTLLDFDASGSLADDARSAALRPPSGSAPLYSSWREGGGRLFPPRLAANRPRSR